MSYTRVAMCVISNVPAIAQQLGDLAANLPHQHILEAGLTLHLLRCHTWAGSKGTIEEGVRGGGNDDKGCCQRAGARAPADLSSAVAIWDGGGRSTISDVPTIA